MSHLNDLYHRIQQNKNIPFVEHMLIADYIREYKDAEGAYYLLIDMLSHDPHNHKLKIYLNNLHCIRLTLEYH